MPLPIGKGMFTLGAIILWSAIINALLIAYVGWGSQWYFDYSPAFIFIGVLLATAFISDHKVALIIAAVAAMLWWYYIVGI